MLTIWPDHCADYKWRTGFWTVIWKKDLTIDARLNLIHMDIMFLSNGFAKPPGFGKATHLWNQCIGLGCFAVIRIVRAKEVWLIILNVITGDNLRGLFQNCF